MIRITDEISLDFSQRSEFLPIFAKQGDNGTRFVQIHLLDHGLPSQIPEDASLIFRAVKPDGTTVRNLAQLQPDGSAVIELTQQVLAIPGDVIADIQLLDQAQNILASASFLITVNPAPDGPICESRNEVGILEHMVLQAQAAAQDAAAFVKSATATVHSELEQAKNSGMFNGPQGKPGPKGDTPPLDPTLTMPGYAADAEATGKKIKALVDIIYPIGSIYTSTRSVSPSQLFGGTWNPINGRFLFAETTMAGYPAGQTGGEYAHQLSQGELPKISGSIQLHGGDNATNIWHTSGILSSGKNLPKYRTGGSQTYSDTGSVGTVKLTVGENQSHNNMPPYLSVYMWKRTA